MTATDTARARVQRATLTTTRGAAAWGLELSRDIRGYSEGMALPRERAATTFQHAAHHCAVVMAESYLGGLTVAGTWAEAYRLLMDRAARAERVHAEHLTRIVRGESR